MFLYVVRRLLQILPLLLLISAMIFTLLYLMPGDPLYRMLKAFRIYAPKITSACASFTVSTIPSTSNMEMAVATDSCSIPAIRANTASRFSISSGRR